MLTLSQAAKKTGKSKSVISRALENGRIVAMKNDDGSYAINPADLFSVFAELPPEPAEQNAEHATSTATGTAAEPQQNTRELPERAGQVDDLRSTIADLQARLDAAEADRRQLEADRRKAGESNTRQIDQLTQLLAMEKKEKQALQLEHKPDENIVSDLQKKLDANAQERRADAVRIKQLSQQLKQAERGFFGRLFA